MNGNWILIESTGTYINMDRVVQVETLYDYTPSGDNAVRLGFDHAVENGFGNIVQNAFIIENPQDIASFWKQFKGEE